MKASGKYPAILKVPGAGIRAYNGEAERAGKGFTDGLLWHCENCNHKLYEVYFELHDIEKDFLPHYQHFYQEPTAFIQKVLD